MKNTIKNTDYSYAAGYVDGDGCFNISKQTIKNRTRPKYQMRVIVTSTNIDITETFKDMFGGTIQSGKQYISHHKPIHHLIMCKNIGVKFAKNIIPYLVERKSEAEVFINFSQAINTNQKDILITQMNTLKKLTNLVYREQKEEFEAFKNTIKPTEVDFAYLAGFIDAECCFCISKYKPKDNKNYTYKIMLQLNNSKSPCFKWLLERFGGHINFIDRNSKDIKQRNQFCWRLSGRALSKIISRIFPFLRHKKLVCHELIKFYATTLKNGGARHTDEFRSSYANIIKVREEIVNKVHLLNLKGI